MRTISEEKIKIYLSVQDRLKLKEKLNGTYLYETQYGEMVFKTQTETERIYITQTEVRKYDCDRLEPLGNKEVLVLAEIFKQDGHA